MGMLGQRMKREGLPADHAPGRARHALRRAVDRRRDRQAARGRVDEDPRAAAVPAVRGEHDGERVRRGRRARREAAPRARDPLRRCVPRRHGLHQGAGAERQRLLDEARPAAAADHVVPRRAAPHARARRSLPLPLPRHRAAARAGAGARVGPVVDRVPVALRPRRVAEALHGADARVARRAKVRARRRRVPRLRVRLPRDARGDRDRGRAWRSATPAAASST